MKLQIKQTETAMGGVLALCSEDGQVLPAQMSVTIDSRPGDIVKATVVFALGDDVVLANGVQRSPMR